MTTQTLNLYGLPREPLHHPKLAAAACWLFSFDNLIGIAVGIVGLSLSAPSATPLRYQIQDYLYLVHTVVIIAAASALVSAPLTRPISPWPRCGILIFILCTVSLGCVVNTTWGRGFLFQAATRPIREIYDHVFLPLLVIKFIASACAFACELIYGLQLAATFHSKSLRKASLFILGPALLLSVSVSALYANTLANVYEAGLVIPYILYKEIQMTLVIAAIAMSTALFIFFTVIAVRLPRLARP